MSCKYCKTVTVNEDLGERTNGCNKVISLIDGSTVLELQLNRYIVESQDKHDGELILEHAVKIDGSVFTVKQKSIKIKYCPFCGEEL